MNKIRQRLSAIEHRLNKRSDGGIVVWWPGQPEPEHGEGVLVIKVVYEGTEDAQPGGGLVVEIGGIDLDTDI